MAVKAVRSVRQRILSKKKKGIRNQPRETLPFHGQVVENEPERERKREREGEISRKEGKSGNCYTQKSRTERN